MKRTTQPIEASSIINKPRRAQHPQAEATLVKVSPGGTVPTHRGGHPREVATAVGALGCHLRMGCDGGLLEGSRRLGFFLAKG
ncbi:hypothetical protein BHE74_00058391 [Ensete ventricosum]|nr:hypothetical protein BHE74_00058391 [Ensete ventricosum]